MLMVLTSALFISGCQTQKSAATAGASGTDMTQTPAAPAAETVAPAALVLNNGAYRVKAGSPDPFTDSEGRVWQADQGFDGGDITDRDPDTKVTGTSDPKMFLSEHYGMDGFSAKVPNGHYTANLYFAETYDGITGPGDRVFSFDVMGHEFKDFDLWVKAGGPYKAYVVTVPVDVTNGVFKVDFTSQVENPEINAIELIPQ